MANSHATLKQTKFYLNISQEDKRLEDRLTPFLTDANEWFERGLRDVLPSPVTITTDTTAVASQYAAGLWELANSSDKTKVPANIMLAEKALQKHKVGLDKSISSVVSTAGPWPYGSLGRN